MSSKKKSFFGGGARDSQQEGRAAAAGADDIAIIGLAVKLPGAEDEDSLLRLLRAGEDQVRAFPRRRVADVARFVDYYTDGSADTARFFRGAWLDRVDQFDREQFRMSEAEAQLCDPHQRLFLQTAWRALQDAGYGGEALRGSRTAVIACGDSKKGISYLQLVTEQAFDLLPLSLTGNIASFTPGRLSYLFDLQGPASVVDTGCCSSLVGVYQACRGLATGDYDYAVVGSCELNFLPLDTGLRVGIESSDGYNRSFSGHPSGTGFGEGAIAVLLKRHADARRDGDAIHAVIRAGAVNHGGHGVGLTAPAPSAQAEVIETAWRRAGVHPDQLGYIEGHGTATAIGDPIELKGLTLAYRRHSARQQGCALGTFKSYIGHLMNCAGLAGLLRATLAVKHGEIFPSLHFRAPSDAIDFCGSPFYLADRVQPWIERDSRIAGVSSFGMSGTNCHLVVEAAAPASAAAAARDQREPHLLPISARNRALLDEHVRLLRDWLEAHPQASLAAVAATLTQGRQHDAERVAVVASSIDEAVASLDACLSHGGSSLESAAQAFVTGAAPPRLEGEAARQRTHMPAPPLALARHWIDPEAHTLFDRYAGSHGGRGADAPSQPDAADLRDEAQLLTLVRKTFARKLGVSDVDPDVALAELGGGSMAAIQIASTLSKQLPIALADVHDHPSARGLTRCLLRKQGAPDRAPDHAPDRAASFAAHVARIDTLLDNQVPLADDLADYRRRAAECVDRDAAVPEARQLAPAPSVLITGATGYLGAHLVLALLDDGARVTALVRSRDPAAAQARLRDVLAHYHGAERADAWLADGTLAVCCGDAGQPRFGLEPVAWQHLRDDIDEVVHLAARVRHAGDYAPFQRDNVDAVAHVIDLCLGGRARRLQFASSMAVAHGDSGAPLALFTELDRPIGRGVGNPYSRSKIAAEGLLEAAREQGLDVGCYRFGNVMHRSSDGRFQRNIEENGIYGLLRAFLLLGMHPRSGRAELDLGCVDHMVGAFMRLRGSGIVNGTFHVYNPHRISIDELCASMAGLGFRLEALPLDTFLRRLEKVEPGTTAAAAAERVMFHLGYLSFDPAQRATTWRVENELTNRRLAGLGFEWPRVSTRLLQLMILGADRTGFFPSLPVAAA